MITNCEATFLAMRSAYRFRRWLLKSGSPALTNVEEVDRARLDGHLVFVVRWHDSRLPERPKLLPGEVPNATTTRA